MQKENRNNRVHTGEKSGKTDFLIEGLLPVGKENAITTQDLVKLSGCGSARELQQRIAYEREQGAIICSESGRGYWRSKDRQEIQEFVHTMECKEELRQMIENIEDTDTIKYLRTFIKTFLKEWE